MQFPVPLAVASTIRELPADGERWAAQPKYDGWRICVDGGRGRLHSRSENDLTSRFPEIAAAVSQLGDVVLDGELVAAVGDPPRLQFSALQAGPALRRARGVQVYLMAFDVLARDGRDLRPESYERRRAILRQVVGDDGPGRVQLVPSTVSCDEASEWLDPAYGDVGVEGVVLKPLRRAYRSGRSSGWLKLRHVVTSEAVVAGVTGSRARPAALVLARRDPTSRRWRIVGLTTPVSAALRAELAPSLRFAGVPKRLPGLCARSSTGEQRQYWPVHREVVVEIATDGTVDAGVCRHPVRAVRVRGDLAPADLVDC